MKTLLVLILILCSFTISYAMQMIGYEVTATDGGGGTAVAFDNSKTVHGSSVTSLTTGTFTISGSNRVGIACLYVSPYTISAVTVTIAGIPASAISGMEYIDSSGNTYLKCFSATAISTGTQTASASWTTSASGSLNIMTFTGTDQTTPVNNVITSVKTAFGTTISSGAITSASGDMTITAVGNANFDPLWSTNQTIRNTDYGSSDTGTGSGTTTHNWTHTGAAGLLLVGGNIKQQ